MSALPQSSKLAYAGGNEVFFSFLRSLMESVDQGTITQDQYRALLRQWGSSLAARLQRPPDLPHALEQIASLFRVMGLVRLFEPAPHDAQETPMILVMRCMISRYLFPQRRQKNLPTDNVIAFLLEGMLHALKMPYRVVVDDTETLHGDEYILRLLPRA